MDCTEHLPVNLQKICVYDQGCQRHQFLRAEASGDILKVRVSAIAFPGVFKKYLFQRGHHVVLTEYTQDWEQYRQNVPSVPRHYTV